MSRTWDGQSWQVAHRRLLLHVHTCTLGGLGTPGTIATAAVLALNNMYNTMQNNTACAYSSGWMPFAGAMPSHNMRSARRRGDWRRLQLPISKAAKNGTGSMFHVPV